MAESTRLAQRQPAYVESIELEQFMCHEKFAVEFNPLITMISGENGSGKSAVLTALTIVFGARAKDTGRGSQSSDLILRGRDVAYIRVVVKLPQPSVSRLFSQRYGEKVTIEKRITHKTTSITLYDSHGNRVKVNQSQAEVREIARHCGFYASNPLAMLNQENAKRFLKGASPKEKYKRVREALRLTLAERDIEQTSAQVHIQEEREEHLKQQIEELESKIETLKRYANVDDDLVIRERVLAWRNVERAQKSLDFEKQKLEEQARLAEDESETINAKYTEALEKKNEEISTKGREFDEIEAKILEAREKVTVLKDDLDGKTVDLNSEKAELESCQNVLKDLKKELEELETRASAETREAEMQALKEDIVKLSDDRVRYENRIDTLEIDLTDLESAHKNKEAQATEVKEAMKASQKLREEASRELEKLRREQQGRKRSHDETSVLDQIIRSEPDWREPNSKRRPKGPLGNYVEVTDTRWKPVLETLLSKTNTSYWVTNSEDHTRLLRSFKKRGIRGTIYTRRAEMFDFGAGCISVDKNKYTRVLDVLEFKDPLIQRLYVDLNRIEHVALCDSLADGLGVMRQRPQNLRTVISAETRNGKQVTRKISLVNGREISEPFNLASGASSMKSTDSSAIGQLEADLKDYEEQYEKKSALYNAALGDLTESRSNVEQLEIDLDAAKSKLADTIKRLERCEKRHLELSNLEPPDQYNLEKVRNQVETQKKMVAAGLETQKELEAEVQAAIVELSQAKEELKGWERTSGELNAMVRRLHLERDQLIKSQDQELRANTLRLRSATQQKQELESRVATAQDEFDSAQERAKAKGGTIGDTRKMQDKTISDLETQISELRHSRQRLNQDQSSVEDRRRVFQESKERLERARISLRQVVDERNILKSAHKSRQQNLIEEWEHLKTESSRTFGKLLRKMNFRGSLVYDDKRETLDMKIISSNGSVQTLGTLSGGESSFTQVALVVSVWRCMPVNMVAMDEYDVFMDRQTRHRALTMMLSCLEENRQQCLLITPLDLDSSSLSDLGDKLTICRLIPPRPQAGS